MFRKSAAEPTRRGTARSQSRSPSLNGRVSRYDRDAGRRSRIESWPAEMPVSPATRKIIDGEVFKADGDIYKVDDVLPAAGGAQEDVLIIRGAGWMRRDDRPTCRALQVRDVEQMIAEERIDFLIACSAKQFELSRGRDCGGLTLGPQGIAPGGDE